MLFENEQKKYDSLIKAINKGESKEKLIACVDELVNAFMPFYDGICFPHDEFVTEKYLVFREPFVSSYDGCVNYGYTLYEWTGGYEEPPKNLPDLKSKEWRMIFHCTSEKKQKLNQEWIDETLNLLDLLHKDKK